MQIAIKDLVLVTTAPGGTAAGYITVTDNTPVFPGAFGSIVKSDTTLAQIVQVTDLVGSTKVGLRFVTSTQSTGPSYGHSDCSAYPAGSVFCLFKQTVSAQPLFRKTS